jgi:hypothetical protein
MKIESGRKALMSQLGSIGKSRLRLNIGGEGKGRFHIIACGMSDITTPHPLSEHISY